MTVIVWDGERLVTDRKATDGSLKWESSKAWYVTHPDYGVCIATGVGHLSDIITSREWFANGSAADKWPFLHKETSCQFIVVTTDGLLLFEKSPYPVEYGVTPCAFGHGRDFAYGAIAMGANAEQAVDAANRYSQHCGLGKEIFSLHESKLC